MSHQTAYAFKEVPDVATLKGIHSRRIREHFGNVEFAVRQVVIIPILLDGVGVDLHHLGIQRNKPNLHVLVKLKVRVRVSSMGSLMGCHLSASPLLHEEGIAIDAWKE